MGSPWPLPLGEALGLPGYGLGLLLQVFHQATLQHLLAGMQHMPDIALGQQGWGHGLHRFPDGFAARTSHRLPARSLLLHPPQH